MESTGDNRSGAKRRVELDREILGDQPAHWCIAEVKDHQHARQQQQALATEQNREAGRTRRAVIMGKTAGDIMIDIFWIYREH